MDDSVVFSLAEGLSELYSIDEMPDISDMILAKKPDKKEAKKRQNKYIGGEDEEDEEDEEEGEEGDYNSRFGMTVPASVYMGHAKKSSESGQAENEKTIDELNLGADATEPAEQVEYRNAQFAAYADAAAERAPQVHHMPDMLSIEYETPHLINGQNTYQRLVFRADTDSESVYELSMKMFEHAGIEASADYDKHFDSMLFTSINGKSDGNEGNFNEFYLNGEIGSGAIDQVRVKKGDIIEWRYAQETDGSCGGVPDYSQIKSLMQYNAVTGELPVLPFGDGGMLYGR